MSWIMKQGLRKLKNRPVIQYALDGTYIKEWPSARVACETLGLGTDLPLKKNGQPQAPNRISGACNHTVSGEFSGTGPLPAQVFGYRWAYKFPT